ncbi:hypothetical protein GCM10008023_19680 [Sphingomonas glacialis]|uniref:AAA+ ATPase domain-containing protein n=1 Tax=Sphingomonas glacialis TaxID=658225 RepID=A0ABQ3LN52_9SPHN|nr:AAA family ATPase [Sphingomonas glacialis]GHH16081.1 hypothetical protein GCM10008023_19680 [Sphingomonas glacialis]
MMATAANLPEPLDFAQLMTQVATRLLGTPNERMSKGSRLRFGTHGSMEIDTDEGWFCNHESDGDRSARGGVLDLIQHRQRCDRAGALRWLEDQGLKDRTPVVAGTIARKFYDYRGPDGTVLFRVERRGKDMSPPFLQHGPDGCGGFHSARGCMQGVARVPYRLPELLAADPAAIVYVCEGEKDVDRLTREGLVATTNPGGAGKFTADLAVHLAGRRVVALEDNDAPGAAHVAAVLKVLAGVAGQAAALKLPDLPPKGDVSDWLDTKSSIGSNRVFDLTQLSEGALTAPVAKADIFDIADLAVWARTAPSPKAFIMAPFIPRDDVVIITGDGGTNKSTLALQISACAAAGKRLLGMDVVPGPALYITAEDDQRENHWRLDKIAQTIGTTVDRLIGRLHIVSLRGRMNNELATFDSEGKLRASPAYKTLRATIEHTGAKLVTLDNVAHLFAGNENDRSHVTAFVNLLYQICGDLGVTILLIAHRNKAGDSYSGSTAWLNAVRSQLLMERHNKDDPDARRLSLGKANYARQGESVECRWHDFALILNSDLPEDQRRVLAATIQATADNAAFLACLAERTRQGRGVSDGSGTNYAPAVFAEMPEGRNIGNDRMKAAMERLFRINRIEKAILWRDKAKSRDVSGLREVAETSPTDHPDRPPTTLPDRPRPVPPTDTPNTPSPKGDTGAASRATAPANSLMILAPGEGGDDVEL